MTVYARSDLASTTVSPAHGGCGQIHTRPAPGGKPVPMWALTCRQCEDFLRADPLWGTTSTSVPETPDETQAREAAEGRTQREQNVNSANALVAIGEALNLLARNQADQSRTSPETAQLMAMMTAMLAQNGVTVPSTATQTADDTTPATDTHEARPGALTDAQRAELESALNTMAADPAWDRDHREVKFPKPPAADPVPDFDSMGMPALNEYAKSLGLPGRRSKAEQIDAIRSHLNL